MSDSDRDPLVNSSRLPEAVTQRVCEEFAAAWRSKSSPRIEGFVSRLPTSAREGGLRALIALEVQLLRTAGESATAGRISPSVLRP